MKKLFTIAMLFLIVFTGCGNDNYEIYEFDYFYFDTSINIKVYYTKEDDYDFEKMNQDIDQILNEIELTFSRTDQDSELYELNEQGYLENPSEHLTYVLNEAIYYCEISDGRYDPTIGVLIELWSISNENNIPTEEEIAEAISYSGCQDVIIEDDYIEIPEGYIIDLGSIVKGYAADVVEQYLVDQGVYSALINLGGNIQLIGSKPDGEPFKIGITAPDIESEMAYNAAYIEVTDKSIVTSGINERFFIYDEYIYHHILDLSTGYPVDNSLASVTIISDNGLQADALSTVIFVMGLEEGMEYIESLEGVEAIFITRDNEIYSSSGAPKLHDVEEGYTKK